MKPTERASGFLLVRKPAGMTSHDVVAAVRRARGVRRVGHGGTLDPRATGLLIVAIGGATKHLREILTLPKTYRATVTLGARSTTDDAEGTITPVPGARVPTRGEVDATLARFRGEITQTPPAYSAVKVRGEPAYRRARRGEHVTLRARRVTIHDLRLLAYAHPRLDLEATVSSGTYIRALARDLGEALGTGAVLSALERTAIGPYRLADAVSLDDVGTAPLQGIDV